MMDPLCLQKYRKKSFQVDPKSLSDTRLLANNNVYLFHQDERKSVVAHMQIHDEDGYGERGQRIIKQVKVDLGIEQGISPISPNTIAWCHEVSRSRHADYADIQRTTSSMLVSAAESRSQGELIAANVLHHLGINFANQVMDISMEDTYVHGVVGVLLEAVFQSMNRTNMPVIIVGLALIECMKI
ncbi:hypothetical protein O0I10_005699 [Lichtheimia ornata]|uniref:Uncharacterized protein n=1 Tax=Lichtheimia ornata TaxID=688661 RepID=A0AAD7V3J8_9FUNG|nr:uncharacterized protein O0I10_005699 [Lichtheimia ornata]KAJ8658659.1 hypothetical protein O0I10_005699 [Lichtheimia ornata]